MEERIKRIASGFFLIPVVVLIVLYSSIFWLSLIVSLVILLSLWEYIDITLKDIPKGLYFLGMVGGGSVPFFLYLYGIPLLPLLLFATVGVLFIYSILFPGDIKRAVVSTGMMVAGVVYVAYPLSYFIPLREMEDGRLWILFVLFVLWAGDMSAYYVGRRFGRHRLAPLVSPGKTVEGAVGGICGGVGCAVVFDTLFTGMGLGGVFILGLGLSVLGMVGDLSESLIKRGGGVKDSGTIIPGHGGMLDRIDSMVFAVPFTYYYILWHQGGPTG